MTDAKRDIVERLRSPMNYHGEPIFKEAAAEIERLRGLVQDYWDRVLVLESRLATPLASPTDKA